MKKLTYFLRYRFVRRFDPYHDYFRQGIRTALSCLLAIFVYRLLPTLPEDYWIILAATFIVQTRLGDTPKQQLLNVITSGLLASITVFLAVLVSSETFILAIYLAIAAASIGMASLKSQNKMLSVHFIVLLTIMSGGLPLHESHVWHRSLFILIGTLCALLSSCLWLESPQSRFKRILNAYWQAVTEFIYLVNYSMITGLKREARRDQIHERRNRLMRQIRHLRNMANMLRTIECHTAIHNVEEVWKLVVGYGNLRFFIVDTTQQQLDFIYAQQQLVETLSRFISKDDMIDLSDKIIGLPMPKQADLIDNYVMRIAASLNTVGKEHA